MCVSSESAIWEDIKGLANLGDHLLTKEEQAGVGTTV